MTTERPIIRRRHDFRRVTDVTEERGKDGDSLYRMPSDKLDHLVQRIQLPITISH